MRPGVRLNVKIRTHLQLLVVAALVPLLLFSAGLTGYSWWEQRRAVEVRQLERVRALTMALDTELQATMRVMRVLSSEPTVMAGDDAAFADRMRDVMESQPLWSTFAVGDAEWKRARAASPAGVVPPPAPDPATRHRVLQSGQPAVSGIVKEGDRLVTQLMVPVNDEGGRRNLLLVVIDHRRWLDFMSQYPVGSGAILTLLDQDGMIIARTRNIERFAGHPATERLIEQSRKTVEANFRNTTLEGEKVYTAHSRSVRWGWTLATGIPASVVESALFESTLLLVGTAVASGGLAFLLAFLYGRRIAHPIDAMGHAAHALAAGEEPRPIESSIREVREATNAFDYASEALRERQRALNEALEREQRARVEAEEASRAKDQFLAMLGHELRNPLNAVTGAAALQQQLPPDSPQAARARDIISRQTVKLRDLVDDLLDVARVTSGKIVLDMKPVDLADIARHAVATLSASGRLAHHELDVETTPTWVRGDDTRLEQIVTNLLDNAAKYTPHGGRIALRVGADGARGVVQVQDSGMGIPPELLPRVFDLFTQGERTIDRSQGGLGLGLALVRRLVELHGGEVGASSDGAGQGACFSVNLPLAQAPAAAAAAPAAEERERKLRILIVEDNPDGRETLALMLGMEGHEVHAAEDGPSGVKEALEWTPDAAIVDIGLPGFDGYEVARRIRAAAKGFAIKLVALTGYGQEEDRRAAMAAGFDSFLVKPADFKAIHTILATV